MTVLQYQTEERRRTSIKHPTSMFRVLEVYCRSQKASSRAHVYPTPLNLKSSGRALIKNLRPNNASLTQSPDTSNQSLCVEVGGMRSAQQAAASQIWQLTSARYMALSLTSGVLVVCVLIKRALRFGDYIGAPDFWKVPYSTCGAEIPTSMFKFLGVCST